MSPIREQILKTVDGYLAAFNTNTPEGTIALRSPDCKHHVLPKSAGHPVRSNEEYRDFISPGFQIMKPFIIKLADGVPPIIDEEQRKVTLYLASSAETPIGPYVNEYVFTLRTNDSGTEIVEVVEFIDSAYTAEFMTKIMAFIGEQQQK
ncbi:uncharacterized protein DNG_08062 [Cephalotrichum gorgonifer]|uniref:SnoaL-like domain-containing protein n=1 Tax=Cephalotrichum gorgonifer TaxID=2041049 RepID=A0AAE8N321_9PEZI|nr:uncharacterized protein DNG_08062 [Cephalotrichum gorgonifer]